MKQETGRVHMSPYLEHHLPLSLFYQGLFDQKTRAYVLLVVRFLWIGLIMAWLCYERYAYASVFSSRHLLLGWKWLALWGGISALAVGFIIFMPKWDTWTVWSLMGIDALIIGALIGVTGAHYSLGLLPAALFIIGVILFTPVHSVIVSHGLMICACAFFVWHSWIPEVVLGVDWKWLVGGYGAISVLAFSGVFYLEKCIRPLWLNALSHNKFKELKELSFEFQPHGMMLCDQQGYILLTNPYITPFISSVVKSGKSILSYDAQFNEVNHIKEVKGLQVKVPHPDTHVHHTFQVDTTELNKGSKQKTQFYLLQWLDVTDWMANHESETLKQKWQMFHQGIQRVFKDFWPALEAYMSLSSKAQSPGDDAQKNRVSEMMQQEQDRLTNWAQHFRSRFIEPIGVEKQPEDVLRVVTQLYEQAMRHTRVLSEGVSLWVHNRLSKSVQIMVDHDRLLEALMLVVDNAVDAVCEAGMSKEGIALELDRSEDQVGIHIVDAGGLLGDAIKPYIFDPYFTTKLGHTGMGLSRAYRIVSELGGRLNVSCSGKETRVSVYFEAHEEPQFTSTESNVKHATV